MISTFPAHVLDPQIGEHYIKPTGRTSFLGDLWFKIPKDKMTRIYKFLRIHKNRLYERLKQTDKDFYVLVEKSPGRGFERVVPTTPCYDHDRVAELRNITLNEIEHLVSTSVQLHYYIDPVTLEITGFLGYPCPSHGTEYLQLELQSSPLETSRLNIMNLGALFAALEETILQK